VPQPDVEYIHEWLGDDAESDNPKQVKWIVFPGNRELYAKIYLRTDSGRIIQARKFKGKKVEPALRVASDDSFRVREGTTRRPGVAGEVCCVPNLFQFGKSKWLMMRDSIVFQQRGIAMDSRLIRGH
jgi:hypothetical protein